MLFGTHGPLPSHHPVRGKCVPRTESEGLICPLVHKRSSMRPNFREPAPSFICEHQIGAKTPRVVGQRRSDGRVYAEYGTAHENSRIPGGFAFDDRNGCWYQESLNSRL